MVFGGGYREALCGAGWRLITSIHGLAKYGTAKWKKDLRGMRNRLQKYDYILVNKN